MNLQKTDSRGENVVNEIYFPLSVYIRIDNKITWLDGYSLITMFAEIGGYTGLLLGFSFFDCAKLFNFISEQFQKHSRGSAYKKPQITTK